MSKKAAIHSVPSGEKNEEEREMLKIKAYAKINMYLEVLGLRKDGYHDMNMVMQSVDLYDLLSFQKADQITLWCDDKRLSNEKKNTAYRVATAFFYYTGIKGGVDIKIQKRIPLMAGLGGGSADAAATLLALSKLYPHSVSQMELSAMGKLIGADVPFSLSGGCKRATGIGENLKDEENNLHCFYLIVKPKGGVSTAEAFHLYDKDPGRTQTDIEKCLWAMRAGSIEDFTKYTSNSLEPAAIKLCPEIGEIMERLKPLADACFMTGSGSSVVGLFAKQRKARAALKELEGLAAFSAIGKSVDTGLKMV